MVADLKKWKEKLDRDVSVLGQVHRDLTTQTKGRLIPRDASISEMIGNRCLDLFDRQEPDPVSLLNSAHRFLRGGRHSPGQQTVPSPYKIGNSLADRAAKRY
jgi:hypothetical protein